MTTREQNRAALKILACLHENTGLRSKPSQLTEEFCADCDYVLRTYSTPESEILELVSLNEQWELMGGDGPVSQKAALKRRGK